MYQYTLFGFSVLNFAAFFLWIVAVNIIALQGGPKPAFDFLLPGPFSKILLFTRKRFPSGKIFGRIFRYVHSLMLIAVRMNIFGCRIFLLWPIWYSKLPFDERIIFSSALLFSDAITRAIVEALLELEIMLDTATGLYCRIKIYQSFAAVVIVIVTMFLRQWLDKHFSWH